MEKSLTSLKRYFFIFVYSNKMLVYTVIKNNELIDIAKIRYWLNEHSTKWILYNKDPITIMFFITNMYKRTDYITKSLKDHVLNGISKRVGVSKLILKHSFLI